MSDRAPEAIVTDTAFRNQAVDVRIPLEITPKGMEDHDKAGSEILDVFILKNIREITLETE